jgi:hypothetical protein
MINTPFALDTTLTPGIRPYARCQHPRPRSALSRPKPSTGKGASAIAEQRPLPISWLAYCELQLSRKSTQAPASDISAEFDSTVQGGQG